VSYVVYLVVDQERQLSGLRREADSLRAKEATLKVEHERLNQEQQMLQTDAYMEKLAREELGLVKPGETPYIMKQQNPSN
jgi:cell division protein FtsB